MISIPDRQWWLAMRIWVVLILLFAACGTARASDGVLEINQACAEGPGCFPGDDPGFPVRIANSGSYILTGSLTLPALINGITTQQTGGGFPNDIRIFLDLNGFSISSTTDCSGSPLECSPTSNTDGVAVLFAAAQGGSFQIRDGFIQGMALGGILCQPNCVVENVIASKNADTGISADGVIKDSAAFRNGSVGIDVPNDARVEACKSDENGEVGFSGPGTFTGNVASNNADIGFDAPSSVLIGNTVEGGETGIVCNSCVAHNNVVQNSETGINFSNSHSIYGGNVIDATTTNIVNGGAAVQSAPNICSSGPCP